MIQKIKSFLFKNESLRQTMVKNTFWLLVSQIGGRLIKAIVIIYSARILGASGWGVFSYAIGLAGFLTIFADLGINPVLTKEASRTTEPIFRLKLFSTAFILRSIILFIGISIVIIAFPHLTHIKEAKSLVPLIALILIFDSMREFGFSMIRALQKMELEAALYLFTNIVIVIAGLFFLKTRPTVFYFTMSYVIGTGLGMIATFIVIRDYLKKVFYNFSRDLVKPILSSAWPFAFAAMLGGITINTDIILIGLFRSAEEIGFYSAAQRPIQLLYILPNIMAMSIFPIISRLAKINKEKMSALLEKIISIAYLAALPIALGGFIVASGIIYTLFGSSYHGAIVPFQVLILTIIINFPTTLLSNTIFALDKQKILINFALIGTILNVILDIIAIPKFGIIGAAVATLISQGVSNVYLWQKVKKTIDFKTLHNLKKIFFATVIMASTTISLSKYTTNIFIIIPLSIILYIGVLFITKEKLLKEIKLIFKEA